MPQNFYFKVIMQGISYPGDSGVFNLTTDSWEAVDIGSEICGFLRATSKTPTSAIYEIFLNRHLNGQISLDLFTNVDFSNYLSHHKISPKNYNMQNVFKIEDSTQIQRLFKLIIHNNKLNEDLLQKIEPVITKGFCEPSYGGDLFHNFNRFFDNHEN